MYRQVSLAATLAFACAALGSSPASAISTFNAWNGSQQVAAFGCPDTTTYGQVITVKDKTTLNRFSFTWAAYNPGGSFVYRAEVYAWNGTRATGSALWESIPYFVGSLDSAFHKRTFRTGPLPLTPGAQYVLFVSIDKDYEKCVDSYQVAWGAVDGGTYHKGFFVYQNNAGNEANWTTQNWNGLNLDLAFSAELR